MPALLNTVDPDGLLEYSVVYTDRALNHMAQVFQQVMQDLSRELKAVYNAEAVAIIPGSGTCGMEAVARQLARDEDCVVVRNGWFSYRWSQILDKGKIAKSVTVMNAQQVEEGMADAPNPFAPADIDEVVATIKDKKPAVVFAPHVETSAGMILSDDYIKAMSEATHSVGGLLVIDSIASGCAWLDMKELGIDVVVSAPQKGWSSTPCAGLVMMSEKALDKVQNTESDSFSLDLKQWLTIIALNRSQVFNVGFIKTKLLNEFDCGFQTSGDRIATFERVLAKEKMKHAFLLCPTLLPIAIGHCDLVKVS